MDDETTEISIHAPAWGATVETQHAISEMLKFQSTLPHGERQWYPRGTCSTGYFNPRSRMGSDGICLIEITSIMEFQSTLPHGERREP